MQRVQWTGEENEAECRKWRPTPALLTPFGYPTLICRPTVRTEFRAADGGKTAAYMLRWVNTGGRGEKGPWSEITTATVAA